MKNIESGAYARKQLEGSSLILNWSHGSRFKFAQKLALESGAKSILDYGCGDGTFLGSVLDEFESLKGVDVNEEQTRDCQRRFASVKNISFDLANNIQGENFDLIFCMEVMEHCVQENLVELLGTLQSLAGKNSKVIISVPIEIGPTIFFKYLYRMSAGWRKIGGYEYAEKYSFLDLMKDIFSTKNTNNYRPVYRAGSEQEQFQSHHGHKGFNWRKLEQELKNYFIVDKKHFTPMPILGSMVNSQVWFECKPLS